MHQQMISPCGTARIMTGRTAAIAMLAVAGIPLVAHAGALAPGNVLVSKLSTGSLQEYTPGAALMQTFNFPDFSGGFFDLRDIIVDTNGHVHAYNGTFTPQLSELNPVTFGYTNRPFEGWSTVNNISYGGIGIFNDGVYVTDMATASAGAPQGIVRFSSSGGATVRFATDHEYQDLTVGGDGLLYALRGDTLPAGAIDVFDPSTNAPLRTITLDATVGAADVRGIAVSSAGLLYAAAWNGSIYAADSDGNLLNSLPTGKGNLMDIDLDDAGNLLVGGRFGDVILTTTALTSLNSFTLGGSPSIHVAFTSPLTVPEPALSAAAAWIVLLSRRRRRRGA